MPNKQGTNYTMQEQINIQNMIRFLNPPRSGMNNGEYQELRRDRAQMWNNFIAAQQKKDALYRGRTY